MLRQTDKAYLAGYFDADGSVSVSLNKTSLTVHVSISGRDYKLMNRLDMIYGGYRYKRKSGTEQWRATGDLALKFLEDVQPWVQYKKKQVDACIAILKDQTIKDVHRYAIALAVCKANQGNMAKPRITKTMTRLKSLIRGGCSDEK